MGTFEDEGNRGDRGKHRQDGRRDNDHRGPDSVNHSGNQDQRMAQMKQFFGESFGNRGPTGPKRGPRGNGNRGDDNRGPNHFPEMRPSFPERGPVPERSFGRGRMPSRDGDSPPSRDAERNFDRGADRREERPDRPDVRGPRGEFRSPRTDARPPRMDARPSRDRVGGQANGRDRDSLSDRSPSARGGSSRGPSSRNSSSSSPASRAPNSSSETKRAPERKLTEKKRVVEVEINGDIGTITLKGSADDVRHFQQLLDRANSMDKAPSKDKVGPAKNSNSRRSPSKRIDKRNSKEGTKETLPSKTAPESDLWKYV